MDRLKVTFKLTESPNGAEYYSFYPSMISSSSKGVYEGKPFLRYNIGQDTVEFTFKNTQDRETFADIIEKAAIGLKSGVRSPEYTFAITSKII